MENQLERLRDLQILLQNFCGEHVSHYENLKAELKKFCSVEEESLKENIDELYVEMDREVLNRDKDQSNSSTKEEHQRKIDTIDRKGEELDLVESVQNHFKKMELNDNALQETLRSIQLEIIQIQSGNTIGCDMVHIESLEKKVDEIKRKRKSGEWDLRRLYCFKNHMTILEHPPASMTSPLSGAIEEQGMDSISSCRDSFKGKDDDQIDKLTNDVSQLKIANEKLKEKLMAEKVITCQCTHSSMCKRSYCACVKENEFCGLQCKCKSCNNRIPSGPGSSSTATKSSRCKDITENKVEELIHSIANLIRENEDFKKKLKFNKTITCKCSYGSGCIRRCDCHAIGENCGPRCTCDPKKCTNRN